MANTGFSFDLSKVLKGMTDLQQKMMSGVEVYGKSTASKMVAQAKANATWNDVSGHARGRMTQIAEWQGNKFAVGVQHGVEYGVYLEYAHGKKYAILHPTVNKMSPEVMSGLKTLL